MIQNSLKVMFKGERFKKEEGEEAASMLLGSHSVRTYAATHARRRGVTKDEKEIRGRWKGQGRVSDVHDDVASKGGKTYVVPEYEKHGSFKRYNFSS